MDGDGSGDKGEQSKTVGWHPSAVSKAFTRERDVILEPEWGKKAAVQVPEPGRGEDVIRGGMRGAAQHKVSESEPGEEAVCVGKRPTGVSEPSRVSGIGQARAMAGASLGVRPQAGGGRCPHREWSISGEGKRSCRQRNRLHT